MAVVFIVMANVRRYDEKQRDVKRRRIRQYDLYEVKTLQHQLIPHRDYFPAGYLSKCGLSLYTFKINSQKSVFAQANHFRVNFDASSL